MILSRRLGLGAAALAGLAAIAGSPYRHTKGRLDIGRTVRAIDAGTDHVSALDLAGWIRARKPGLRVIDVRSPQAFAAYAIPTAENIPLVRLMETPFAPHETVVLYSEGGAHAGQAWVLLQSLGVQNAVFIPGGLADWQDEVISPVLSPGTDHARQAELSRYFGGQPVMGDAVVDRPRTPVRRRGC
jgi:rhodanese-related sulfurtransferase